MPVNRKSRITVLKYKFLYEENIQVMQELNEGSADINYHLSKFRRQLDASVKDQHQKFDDTFFGHTPVRKEKKLDDATESETKRPDCPSWAKSLYKKIANMTHPDKTGLISSKALIDNLERQYMISTSAYKRNEYSELIMVGYDLDLHVDDNIVKSELGAGIDDLMRKINYNKTRMGYQWYHLSDSQREVMLKNYLRQMGFTFTSEEIAESVQKSRRASKRKPGQRPVNMRRMRLK